MPSKICQSYARLRRYHLTGLLPKTPQTLIVIGPNAGSTDILLAAGLFSKAGLRVDFVIPKSSLSVTERLLFKLLSVQIITSIEATHIQKKDRQKPGKSLCYVISSESLATMEISTLEELGTQAIMVAGIDRKKRRIKLHTPFVASGHSERDLLFITDSLSALQRI